MSWTSEILPLCSRVLSFYAKQNWFSESETSIKFSCPFEPFSSMSQNWTTRIYQRDGGLTIYLSCKLLCELTSKPTLRYDEYGANKFPRTINLGVSFLFSSTTLAYLNKSSRSHDLGRRSDARDQNEKKKEEEEEEISSWFWGQFLNKKVVGAKENLLIYMHYDYCPKLLSNST